MALGFFFTYILYQSVYKSLVNRAPPLRPALLKLHKVWTVVLKVFMKNLSVRVSSKCPISLCTYDMNEDTICAYVCVHACVYQSQSYMTTDGQSILVLGTHLGPTTNFFPFFL
jgi:hypothetical protein